jgi:hypothetical protein
MRSRFCGSLFVIRLALALGIPLLVSNVQASQTTFVDVSATHLPPPNTVSQSSMDVTATDIDDDGDLDLVIAAEFQANVLLLNDGTGKFTHAKDAFAPFNAEQMKLPPGAPAFLKEGHDSEDIAIVDLNGDGKKDIVIVSEDDMKIGRKNVHEYYINQGGGAFQRLDGVLPDTEANAVGAADVNGDGAVDLYICGASQDRLLINNGKGEFADETKDRLPKESLTGQDIKFVDVNRDNHVDIVIGNEVGHLLFLNDGKGRFSDETKARLPLVENVEARKVTPVDIDRDGDLDLYFAHVGWVSPGTTAPRAPQDKLFLNDGQGVFSDATDKFFDDESLTTLDAQFVDLDGDERWELIQVNFGPTLVLSQKGGDKFVDITDDVFEKPVEGPGVCVELADFNGDGIIDMYIGLLAGPNRNPQGFDRLLFGKGS